MNFKSQYGQDEYLNSNIFKNKKNGVFVDIGAHNGVSLSNTYFFEKELDWTGLCVEPNPKIFHELCNNRSSININGCAWICNEKKIFRLIEGYSEMLSGLVETYDSRHVDRIHRECIEKNSKYVDVNIDCYEINSLLSENGLFKVDLLSIDTEGSELKILESIDYDIFKIDVIIVENNYKDLSLQNFLLSKGYYLYDKIKIDDIYVKYKL